MGYDVFMSFRGEDTRTGFTSHLYDALIRNDIQTYLDDKTLEIGMPIASELLEAIETSTLAIVVISSNFATSKWCLEEIAKIVDCMKRGKVIVIPVFYHVCPSDVRHQSNCFEKGFADHEADPEIAPEKVETWRAAFREVGAISGLHLTQHRDEAEVVSDIVRKILKNLPDTLPRDLQNSLVGIKSRLDEVKRILRMDSSEVLFTGICGMSGIGKTTLAEVVYENIKNMFDESSLIENIKDISKQNDSATLCKLQQKLLDDILMERSIRVQNVIHGHALLSTKLRALKVVVVLDDVNHADQLTYLAGALEWFGPGSRIIVTTTNIDLLNQHDINEIYLCEEMKGDEALHLLCQSAFKQSHPAHGFEKLSIDVVKLAGGLPLALNVYGMQLCGKDESYWNEMLKQLKEYPDEKVLERLEVVYARLDKNQRYVFIYIACFLKGRNIDLVKDILANIGLYPERGITDLLNKCLITINLEDNVWMHDLLQQMCWEILRKESDSYYGGKHIAIKSQKDTSTLNIRGAHTVEVINQEPYKGEVNDCFIIDPTCFSKMTKLKFLRINNVPFPKRLKRLSNELRILEWYGCSLESFPLNFEPKHMYELEMCSSQLKTLWKKDLELLNLRSINLSFSKKLSDIPNLTSASNLVILNLEGCTSLTRLHESVLLQKRLRYLNLKGCTCLESLGRSLMEMDSLEALLLSGCLKLEYIPEFGKNMKRLEHLYVDGTRIKKLPETLGEVSNLRKLDASRTSIEELPVSIHLLKKLRILHVNSCLLSFKPGCFLDPRLDTLSSGLKEVDLSYCNLSVVPDGIGLLCHLITLDVSGNEFVSLPASIGLLSKLRVLCLNDCKRLRSLPKLSLVDEDMDYGPRSRFNYVVSAKEVDLSKYRASDYNYRPTVSCLNCPKLPVDKQGSYFAEKILNSYLELRTTNYWMTPEAVFEIVGAGSEIPSGFVQPGSEGLILEGPWIGVAICAVISVNHVDGYMEANHMVTAHIRLGEKYWKIPVPINFLVTELEAQIILYWTIVDDLQRIVGSSHWGNFNVSFKELDSNLYTTKVGVRFIRHGYIMDLLQSVKREKLFAKEENPLGWSLEAKAVNPSKLDESRFGLTTVCGKWINMEDAVVVKPSFSSDLDFYGVYDGHGCSHVAMKCKDRMHEIVKEEIEKGSDWKEMMVTSFSRMDNEVKKLAGGASISTCRCGLIIPQCDAVGSTAVVAVVTPNKIVVSNCGDSRALLCRNGVAIPLSTDHKPDRPDELARIENAGGRVIYWNGARVLGVLAMSRSIGDSYLKPYVIPEPEVTVTERTPKDECLILASDGLWNVVPNDVACTIARMCLTSQKFPLPLVGNNVNVVSGEGSDKACSDASLDLTKLALALNSSDDISVIVVDLRRNQ